MEQFLHVLLHTLLDTLYIFIFILVIYFLLSFIEGKIAKKIEKNSKFSPILGSLVGLVPQCGFSIVGADLYKKKYISIGTLIAIFVSCSDEAIPIILSSPSKIYMIIPLLLIKFISAISFGYLIDLLFKGNKNLIEKKHHEDKLIHTGCCHHEIEENEKEGFVKKHLIHPLLHTLKITLYVFIINLVFALLIEYIGQNTIKDFLNKNVYLTPILASIVGLIPNCASSVIISELFVANSLSFGATISGLICNAGLGLVYLFKDKKDIKNNFLIISLLMFISLFIGYLTLLIEINLF